MSKLHALNAEEENLREKTLELVARDSRLQLHISVIEDAMDLANMFRQYPTNDEDEKVIQILGMRTFNDFCASLKLVLCGYYLNSAMVMRDILETVFLLDLFKGDRTQIERWRLADHKERKKKFSPAPVRETLDRRDGSRSKKRAKLYKCYSEYAAHPTMKSIFLMRCGLDGDAVSGPFIDEPHLNALLVDMGFFAVQVGDILDYFFPETWVDLLHARGTFSRGRKHWLDLNWTEQ